MSETLFTADELVKATGGRLRGEPALVDVVSIDSRDIAPGALFVAIAGDRFDGHDFVPQALADGAALAMVSEAKADEFEGNLLVVPDPLAALGALARFARARSDARIVAVTGSVGKTTTKEALRAVLSAAGPTHASVKSFNNHWGVPLTLARLPASARFGVFEIGMNHPGEIAPLTALVRPHVAIVTTVAAAHLAAFDGLEGIADAKAEIFSGLEPGGIALLNADHEMTGRLIAAAEAAGAARIVTYGFARGADWRIAAYTPGANGARIDIVGEGEALTFTLCARGRHMAANALAALVAATLAGVPAATAATALEGFGAQAGRGLREVFPGASGDLVLIDESYNANPASMRAALEVFAGEVAPGGRKVLVLGDMRELGTTSRALHADLAEDVEAAGADAIFLVGPDMGGLAERLGPGRVETHVERVEDMVAPLLGALAYGDALMVKGSNGTRLSRLVEAVRQRFARPAAYKDV